MSACHSPKGVSQYPKEVTLITTRVGSPMRGLIFSSVEESFFSLVGVAIETSASRIANIKVQISVRRDAKGNVMISLLWILLKKITFSPFQKHIRIREIIEDFCG